MNVVLLVLVTFFVAACGQFGERSPWPAQISALNGMSETEQSEVRNAVENLNSLSHSEVVSFAPASDEFFSIAVAKSDPTAEHMQRAGYATVSLSKCSIDLSAVIFRPDMKDYILPVVFHELGHCAGLDHSPDESDIMYKTTAKLSQYTQESMAKFIKDFRAAAGL